MNMAEYGAVKFVVEGYEEEKPDHQEEDERESTLERRVGSSWVGVALGIVIVFQLRSRQEIGKGSIRSLLGETDTLGMFFWAFLFTATVPVLENIINAVKGCMHKDDEADLSLEEKISRREIEGKEVAYPGVAQTRALPKIEIMTFDPLDAVILLTYLFADLYTAWTSVLCWIGTLMCLFCSAMGPLGTIVSWPAPMKPIQAFRAVFGYVGMSLILMRTLIQVFYDANAEVVTLISVTIFCLTMLFEICNCAVAWFMKYSKNLGEYWGHISEGGIGNCCTQLWCCEQHEGEVVGMQALEPFSEEALDALHKETTDPLNKLLCMMYLYNTTATGAHDIIVFAALMLGLTSSVLLVISRYFYDESTDLHGESSMYKVLRWRGVVGLGAVALVCFNALFFEVPSTWPALAFLITAIIPFLKGIGWLIDDVRRKPADKQKSTADMAQAVFHSTLHEADTTFLRAFDPIDQVLLTMYVFASTSPGYLVWLGCLPGVFTSASRVLSSKRSKLRSPKVRDTLGCVSVIALITTTLIAHFGF